jgi:polysaccharide deacetylase 2 family uncharacterized protein YibQ
MDVIAPHHLFFIDSRTSSTSQAYHQAQAHNIASRVRDVFLDNDISPTALHKQFQQAIRIARRHGSAILIGHAYPETTAFLHKNLPKINAMGIRLVSASALFTVPTRPEAH